jgi:hypothetical protein
MLALRKPLILEYFRLGVFRVGGCPNCPLNLDHFLRFSNGFYGIAVNLRPQ